MSPTAPSCSIPVLPLLTVDSYEFKFVSEGNSNIVFEVVVQPSGKYGDNIFQGAVSHALASLHKSH